VVVLALVAAVIGAVRVDSSPPDPERAAPQAESEGPALPDPVPDPVPEGEPLTVLALGDSVAAGVGASPAAENGYVGRLVARLADDRGCERTDPGCVALVDLAVPGATTRSLVATQLPRALDALQGRDPDVDPRSVGVVTLTVGGNDVYAPLLRACSGSPDSSQCLSAVQERLTAADEGLEQILTEIRQAAGPETSVAVMTYYNPLPACIRSALAPLADLVLEGGEGVTRGLNDALRERAAQVDGVVVETGPLLGVDDFVGGVDCLHPAGSGHAIIADAFADALSAG
jgi:lysophospholipase L1-like esterase